MVKLLDARPVYKSQSCETGSDAKSPILAQFLPALVWRRRGNQTRPKLTRRQHTTLVARGKEGGFAKGGRKTRCGIGRVPSPLALFCRRSRPRLNPSPTYTLCLPFTVEWSNRICKDEVHVLAFASRRHVSISDRPVVKVENNGSGAYPLTDVYVITQ